MGKSRRMAHHLRHALRPAGRFWSNRKGIASIEFAATVPLMVMLFIGIVEFSQALTVDRRVNQVASSTADLIARTESTTTGELNGIMNIIEELMRPYSQSPLKLSVTNVIASTSDETNTVVCWSHPHNGGATYAKDASYTLPSGIVEKGESVVVVEAKYDYTPQIFSYFITSAIQFTDTFYLKPRISSSIELDNVKCSAPA
ncbi:MAG: TadE/TadG family type IV pilus assembly protein [Hyphomicrobiaceae bacterium]